MTIIDSAKANIQVEGFKGPEDGLHMLQSSSREAEDVDSWLDGFSRDQEDATVSVATVEDGVLAVMEQVPTPVDCVDPRSTTFPAAQDWLRQHVI